MLKTSAILLAAAITASAHAQTTCYTRYEHAFEAAQQARFNAPDSEKHQLALVEYALNAVLNYLGKAPTNIPADVCGTTLSRVEAQAMVWHEKGWTPTDAEKQLADRDAALKSLNTALDALEKQ